MKGFVFITRRWYKPFRMDTICLLFASAKHTYCVIVSTSAARLFSITLPGLLAEVQCYRMAKWASTLDFLIRHRSQALQTLFRASTSQSMGEAGLSITMTRKCRRKKIERGAWVDYETLERRGSVRVAAQWLVDRYEFKNNGYENFGPNVRQSRSKGRISPNLT